MKGLFDQKLVFFGGKGGVGKTTCASAFALLAAGDNRRTLLVSTDLAHSVSDLFQTRIGNSITELQPNLYGLEIDPDAEAAAYIGNIKARFAPGIDPDAGRAFSKQMDLAAASPGTQEAALFDRITDLITRMDRDYDLLVFDTAPTGQTLRLLALPELMGSWIEALTKRREKVSSLWSMFSRSSREPAGEDPVLGLLEKRREKFAVCRKILVDPAQTGFYLVLTPERLPILETRKAIPVLQQYRIPIRRMIVNRLLPETPDSAYLGRRKEQERAYLKEIENLFRSWSPVYLYQRENDVMSPDGLKELAGDLQAVLDPPDPGD